MREIEPKKYHRHIPHNTDDNEVITTEEGIIQPFEKRIISLHNVLRAKEQLPGLDPIRRAAEEVDGLFDSGSLPADMPDFLQDRLPRYGERRILAVETVLHEMGLITQSALDQETTGQKTNQTAIAADVAAETQAYRPKIDELSYPKPRYRVGDTVQVAPQAKPGHIRIPIYLLGQQGRIISFQGMFLNPEDIAHFRENVLRLPLYLVEFDLADIRGEPAFQRITKDKVRAEIYEPWLSSSTINLSESASVKQAI